MADNIQPTERWSAAGRSLDEMEATARRFEERVYAAQAASPATKDFVRAALRRQGAPRCPIRMRRLSAEVIIRYGDKLADLFCEYPDDIICLYAYDLFVGYQPPEKKNPVRLVESQTQDLQWVDEWGTEWGHTAGGAGSRPINYPLQDWAQLDDYLKNNFPDPLAAGRWAYARKIVETHKANRYIAGILNSPVFDRLHFLRGMENLFEDFFDHTEELEKLIAALTDYAMGLVKAWVDMGVDAVFMLEDLGTQRSLMMSPKMWERFLFPAYSKIFSEIHRHGMDVLLHTCGNVTEIVDKLIEAGVDVLDPIQPGPMNQAEISTRYGSRLAFSGGIDDQLIAHCSPTEVREEVRRAINTLGKPNKNAYLVATANVITPDVPLENIRALFEAAHEE
jgi:uroporphyrinogen decarboxylase